MRRASGFGLIETMVALVVLAMGMLLATGLLVRGIERGAAARKLTSAQLLGGQILERLRTEIRYDANSAEATTGYSSQGGAFTLANAWRAERLPYKAGEGGGAATGPFTTCNPAGAEDGGAYDVGPFALRHEGSLYYVCYRLRALDPGEVPGAPADSMQAMVKVLWPSNGGWAARWITGPLLDGG